jgi:hypothetical protein
MITVVLGMHKSGTTLISQILHSSGISMGENFDADVSYDKGNKHEREAVLELNLSILGTDDYGVLGIGADRGVNMTSDQRKVMRSIIGDCEARHDNWGFKDPRSALTYNLWAEELPPHQIVAIVRDPAEIWPRFKWQGMRKYLGNFHFAWDYVNRWYEYNANILEILQTTQHSALLLEYESLMTDDAAFAKLQEFVGQPLSDCRRPDLYRSKSSPDMFLRVADARLRQKTGQDMAGLMKSLTEWRQE